MNSILTNLQLALDGLAEGLVVDVHAASGTPIDYISESGELVNGTVVTTDAERPSVLAFDGIGEYFSLNNAVAALSGLAAGTVQARFKTTAEAVGSSQAIMGLSDQSSNTFFTVFVRGSGFGTLRVMLRQAGTTLVEWESTDRFDDGAWHDVQVVVSGSGTVVYIDGVVATGSFASGGSSIDVFFDELTALNDFSIGRLVYDNSGPTAIQADQLLVDRVRIWSEALDAEQLAYSQIRHVVVPLLGQSNMLGRDTSGISSILDDPSPWVKQLIRSAGSDDSTIGEAAHPLDHVDPFANTVGLGLELGKAIRTRVAGIDSGALSVVLVPAAHGGTGFDSGEWQIGGLAYIDAVARVNAAIALGGVHVLTAWHQGESDTGSVAEAASHANGFAAFIESYRSMLTNDGLGSHGDRPFVAGELLRSLSPVSYPEQDAVQAQINAVSALEGVGIAKSVGLSSLGDDLHFDSQSLRVLGLRYYAAWTALLESGEQSDLLRASLLDGEQLKPGLLQSDGSLKPSLLRAS
ncbi:MAG: sialate O-acetylesterase [Planctomycetota bacterium]